MNEIIVSMENICKTFPGVKALDHVNFELRSGEVMALLGENGAGKSTLMKILSGVYTKDAGTVVFDGQTIEKTTPMESLRRGLSIIYQEFSLISSMPISIPVHSSVTVDNIYIIPAGCLRVNHLS